MSRSKLFQVVVVGVMLVLPSSLMLFAQQAGAPSTGPSPSRTVLDKQDLSVPNHEGLLVLTEFPPGSREPLHTHPGDLYAYILDGTLTLSKEGEPTTTLKAGDHFFVKAGQVHWGINNGTTPVKIVVSFFVEKGKPLTTTVK